MDGLKPIIFVHGFLDSHNSPWWCKFKKDLKKHKFCLNDECRVLEFGSVPGSTISSPRLYSRKIRKQIMDEVNEYDSNACIIAHSMGGISARYFLEVLNGDEVVDTLITLGTPHQGTKLAYLAYCTGGGRNITPNSRLINDILTPDSLSETVNYYSFWSKNDKTIMPSENAMINSKKPNVENIHLEGYKHIGLVYKKSVINKVAEVVNKNM